MISNKRTPRRKKKNFDKQQVEEENSSSHHNQEDDDDETGNHYNVDFWVYLSFHIKPEQVKAFSSICKGAYYATTTKRFWLSLYRRHCIANVTHLPSHLTPSAITTISGLKTRVIRALFHSYPPFMERNKHRMLTTIPLEKIENRICQSHWWKQARSSKLDNLVWLFYLKMSQPDTNMSTNNTLSLLQMDDLLDEIIPYNPEKGCSLLRITCTAFLSLQDVSELFLQSCSLSASSDLRRHKLRLTFHRYNKYGIYTKNKAIVLTLDPVLDVFVVPWWNPEYPHPLDD